jgi:hypothetical protein
MTPLALPPATIAFVGIVVIAVLLALLAWALWFAFGTQVFGLPAMIGLLVVLAGISVFGNDGLTGLAFVVVALIALALVIGAAMRLGNDRPGRRRRDGPRT